MSVSRPWKGRTSCRWLVLGSGRTDGITCWLLWILCGAVVGKNAALVLLLAAFRATAILSSAVALISLLQGCYVIPPGW